MNNLSLTSTERQKKAYTQPRIKTVHLKNVNIICTSGQDLDYNPRYRDAFGS